MHLRSNLEETFIFNVAAVPQAAFTAAVTNIITSNAHGLSDGDCIWVSSDTTLPAGLSASTNYYIINAATNTFKLSATKGGSEVDITDTGTGTHTFSLKGKKIYIGDWKNNEIGLYTASSANFTIKIQGSDQDDVDFNAAQSSTNRWDYLQLKDLEDNSSIDGDTGIVLSGTDDNRHFEANINGKRFISAQFTSWTAGKANLTVACYTD